ncbi:MAG TPA: glycoside hydrolase family 2 TIM barrel-domain containing protein [Puia sp.]|nr:glycoside hydrolase family 2 TIM barrel-domain containing protein [Puia sp.]
MKMILRYSLFFLTIVLAGGYAKAQQEISLSGDWLFRIDSLDEGESASWFDHPLKGHLHLPGSLTSNGLGDVVTLHTPWTGEINDSSYFLQPEYAPYRQPGHIKIPFWLQPVRYYKGAAWYQKKITIPPAWKDQTIELFIERAHWETTVWIDGHLAGRQNSLGTPHRYPLSEWLRPGQHTLTIRVDNRIKEVNPGPNSHSVSDHTQSNWNGMIGRLCLIARSSLHIGQVALFPSVARKEVLARITICRNDAPGLTASVPGALPTTPGVTSASAGAHGMSPDAGSQSSSAPGAASSAPYQVRLHLAAVSNSKGQPILPPLEKDVVLQKDSTTIDITYPMGAHPLLWDEFHPNLYTLRVSVRGPSGENDQHKEDFGMREFSTRGTQFTINGRPVFLRGTLECAIFPRTGYPPTDRASWMHIFNVCRSYGLNHMRFHSWCPPAAAFEAADRSGFYLHVECSSWANSGVTVGDDQPLDKYLYEESGRMADAYGNHPSFCMMAYGNEPAGRHLEKYLDDFVSYWKAKDSRRLYTTAAGWPVIPDNDYNSSPNPRIQQWGQGLKSILNTWPARGDYDWRDIISPWQHPTVSHEIGQWCVYPDFSEIPKYTGVLKAKNFEIFQHTLQQHGMGHLADSFLLASGKLQVLCYKADIEAALRTPGFGGFQLLDLHDFPGQGTALVGVLNPFWEDKGYVTGAAYSRFCNAVVPLARMPRMVYLNDQVLEVPVEIANFSEGSLRHVSPAWTIADPDGRILWQGRLPATDIAVGNGESLGVIRQPLQALSRPARLQLTVSVGAWRNSWDFFVYPARLPGLATTRLSEPAKPRERLVVSQTLDEEALATLKQGGKVLLTLKQGSIRNGKGAEAKAGFSTIFWNTAWTHGQPPNTMGILCNPRHPALAAFPTQYHSNWQWCDAFTHGGPIRLDEVAAGLSPIVRVIDDWVTARPLGLIFECRVGEGSLLVSGIDLLTDADRRPEARQLLYSLEKYMTGPEFHPRRQVAVEKIEAIYL